MNAIHDRVRIPAPSVMRLLRPAAPPAERRLAKGLLAFGIAVLVAAGMPGVNPAAASMSPAWSLMASPNPMAPQDGLAAVSCPAANRCVAVGQAVDRAGNHVPLIKAWNGRRWKLQRAAVPPGARYSALAGVSCASARACIAVGQQLGGADSLVPLAERWNGHRWAIQRVPGNGSLAGVSCTSATACIAVGRGWPMPLAERWNGLRWAIQHPAGTASEENAFTGVSCTSARACVAVGYSINGDQSAVPLAERWNGRNWATQPGPGTVKLAFSYLNAVSCVSASACIAVGYTTNFEFESAVPLAERWNGRRWKSEHVPAAAGFSYSFLQSVSCASASACVAVGSLADSSDLDVSQPFAETWNGTAWAIQAAAKAPGSGSLAGVSCSPAGCTAVGQSIDRSRDWRVTLAEGWNGTAWAIQPTPGNPAGAQVNALAAVSCRTSRKCIAVGYAGHRSLAERWNGGSWAIQKTPNPAAAVMSALTAVSCTTGTCVAVGYYRDRYGSSFPLIERWNGKTWSIQQTAPLPGTYHQLTGVSCASATACVAVGTPAQVERWDGTAWAAQQIAPDVSALAAVSCSSATGCMAVGSLSSWPSSMAEWWDGTTWAVQTPPGQIGAPTAVSCATPQACTAVGTGNTVWRWDGTKWSTQDRALAQVPFAGVSCPTDRACTAVGGGNSVLVEHWNGTQWTIQPAPNPSQYSSLQGVSCTSARACVAVGSYYNGIISIALVERYS